MSIKNKYMDDPKPVDTDRLDAILKKTRFNIKKVPERLSPVFYASIGYKDSPIAYPGSLGLLIGAQKVRKTTALKAIAASALGGRKIINFMLKSSGTGKIVFFDTEQRYNSFWETQNQIHRLAGLADNTDRYDGHTFLDETIDDRLLLMERYIELNEDIEMIVIDGALDILEDYNDIREAREVSERIARMANNSKAVVFVVVHASGKFGKGPTNSLGHLGSQLERKCDFAIQLTYNKETHFTEVEHLLSRSFGKFPNFEFTNDENGNPILNYNERVIAEVPVHAAAPPEPQKIDYNPPSPRIAASSPEYLDDPF